MSQNHTSSETVSPWPICFEADKIFADLYANFVQANAEIKILQGRFLTTAGVRIENRIDHWILPPDADLMAQLESAGLRKITTEEGDQVWRHEEARLPHLRFKSKRSTPCMAIHVEDISKFADANQLDLSLKHGDTDSQYECAHLNLPAGELMVIARRGYAGYAPGSLTSKLTDGLNESRMMFRTRSRAGNEREVIENALRIFNLAAEKIGRDRAVDEFFSAEREYYLSRNTAAKWQFEQQQKIGIGWANHDHHTYRCSRESFSAMLGLFNAMGFFARERFYAGDEAGWGAQVLEHPVSAVVIFADLDLAPEELSIDFISAELEPRQNPGTIGLWCALHGSSIAEAGMHHLEAEFDFETAVDLHEKAGHGVMPPFTDLPMLKQAFTAAEMWPILPERCSPLLQTGVISSEQAEKFRSVGAPGSHLEILQRWQGFKGFNKTGVSSIIRETDARR